MLKENALMWRLLCGLVVVLVACTKPNPESCADGSCTDPKFPFCDVNGEVAGTPDKCIAVECNPMQFAACRGDDAIVCNDAGNNFDVVQCQLGCSDGLGCRECVNESHCAATRGICDQQTSSCRACRLDSECSSNACDVDTGKCLPEAGVLYASPNGTAAQPCSKTSPCSLGQALSLANAALPTIRMLPGEYVGSFAITNKTLTIIAGGAIHTGEGPTSILISDGADVSIRGLLIDLTRGEFQCRATPGSPRARLTLRNVVVREPGNQTMRILDCVAKISESEFRGISTNSLAIFQRNSVVDVDRTVFKGGDAYSNVVMSSSGMVLGCNTGACAPIDVRITNSVFDDSPLFFAFGSETASTIRIGFNTFAIHDPGGFPPVSCDNVGNSSVRIESSVIFKSGPDAVVGNGCVLKGNVIAVQATSVSGTGNKFEDPKFVAFPTRDYQLMPDSPARDAATPSGSDLTTDHDLLGVPRPQGNAHDIGAFELKP